MRLTRKWKALILAGVLAIATAAYGIDSGEKASYLKKLFKNWTNYSIEVEASELNEDIYANLREKMDFLSEYVESSKESTINELDMLQDQLIDEALLEINGLFESMTADVDRILADSLIMIVEKYMEYENSLGSIQEPPTQELPPAEELPSTIPDKENGEELPNSPSDDGGTDGVTPPVEQPSDEEIKHEIEQIPTDEIKKEEDTTSPTEDVETEPSNSVEDVPSDSVDVPNKENIDNSTEDIESNNSDATNGTESSTDEVVDSE